MVLYFSPKLLQKAPDWPNGLQGAFSTCFHLYLTPYLLCFILVLNPRRRQQIFTNFLSLSLSRERERGFTPLVSDVYTLFISFFLVWCMDEAMLLLPVSGSWLVNDSSSMGSCDPETPPLFVSGDPPPPFWYPVCCSQVWIRVLLFLLYVSPSVFLVTSGAWGLELQILTFKDLCLAVQFLHQVFRFC